MASLQLTLFGAPRIEREGIPVTPDRRKALALLVLVALTPTPQSRDYLAEMLWPERDKSSARTDLRSTLFVLRQAIGLEWLNADGDRLALRRALGLNVDVLDFRRLITQAAAHEHAVDEPCMACSIALAEAVELYRDDFLAGFSLRDAPEFDNWQTYQTESLRLELAGALERLVGLEAARGDYEAAVKYARRWLALDPLCEEPHRALMRLYAEAGNRAAALRQYEECTRILDAELGIRPDAETEVLRDAVASGEIEVHPVPVPRPPPLELPPDRTPFIGRATELVQIAARLDDPGCRLLTVLGPGGSGKTRLAVQAARDRDGRYKDGIYFVDLAPVESSELLVPAILRALSVPALASSDLTEQLIGTLSGREVLLVLDNLEHLLDGVALLPRLLGAAPGLIPYHVSAGAIKCVDGKIYCVGGSSGGGSGAFNNTLVYDIATNQWSDANIFITANRYLMADVYYRDKFYVIGGLNSSENAVDNVEFIIAGTPSAVETESGIPNDFELAQNYPNPFNPSTTIKFSIPNEEFVSLKVFNSLGEEVAELLNETKPAGNYSVSFNASSLTSGVYFYQLIAGNPSTGSGQGFVETKKMLLMK